MLAEYSANASAPAGSVKVATVWLADACPSVAAKPGPAVATTDGSVIVAESCWLLLAVFGSEFVEVTLRVLAKLVSSPTVTTMVPVTVAPLATVPRLPVTVPPAKLPEPWLKLAETNVRPDGRVSVRVTPGASDGPWFVTVMVYVSVPFSATLPAALTVIATSELAVGTREI